MPYIDDAELYLRTIPYEQASEFLKTPHATELLYLPQRAPTPINMLQRSWRQEEINSLIIIDTMIINERRRRVHKAWRTLFCIAKLLARRPRQRLLQFENISMPQRVYTITAGTKQGLIEKIFERRILQPNVHIIKTILKSQISNLPIGSIGRKTLEGETIPKSWYALYIHGQTNYQDSIELDISSKFTALRVRA